MAATATATATKAAPRPLGKREEEKRLNAWAKQRERVLKELGAYQEAEAKALEINPQFRGRDLPTTSFIPLFTSHHEMVVALIQAGAPPRENVSAASEEGNEEAE